MLKSSANRWISICSSTGSAWDLLVGTTVLTTCWGARNRLQPGNSPASATQTRARRTRRAGPFSRSTVFAGGEQFIWFMSGRVPGPGGTVRSEDGPLQSEVAKVDVFEH